MAQGQRAREVWDLEDRTLLQKVARGDVDAFRDLFHRYYPRIYSFVQRRLGDATDAEDTTVEIFSEIWRTAKQFRGESRPSTWLYGIAHFKSLSARRAAGRAKRANVIPVDFETLSRNPGPDNPEAEAGTHQEVERVRAAVRALPDRYRKVLELAYFDGLPYREIAQKLGMAEGTVKTQVSRARTKLRKQLVQAGQRGAV